MIPVYIIALFAHYLADFPAQAFFQSSMGQKHKRFGHLLNHIVVYGSVFGFVLTACGISGLLVLAWIVANVVLHGCIDFWTSRASHACHGRALAYEAYPQFSMGILPKWLTIANMHTPQRDPGWRGLFWSGYALGVL